MNRKLLIAVLSLATLLLTSFAIKATLGGSTRATAGGSRDDYYFRHADLSIPVTGASLDLTGSDYYERHQAEMMAARGPDLTEFAFRHPELSVASARQVDTSDYFQRNPDMRIVIPATAPSADLTDYAARHPGTSIVVSSAPAVDLTDYSARHPGMSIVASNAPAVDLTDYAARHPELSSTAARQVDTTDYFFRHPELSR